MAPPPGDLPIRCSCGALRGALRGISPDQGNHIVCYCDDCQSFAHYLERADEILDKHGGSDIFQHSPAKLEISEGADKLAAVRLTESGLMRWYASCCNTPIGNTLGTYQVPFVGLVVRCIDQATDQRTREAAIGPIRARVNARFAKGNRAELDAYDRAPISMLFQMLSTLLMSRLRGDHKRSPFFDPDTGAPCVTPRVLSTEELQKVEAARDAN
jgi:hypothetical protein